MPTTKRKSKGGRPKGAKGGKSWAEPADVYPESAQELLYGRDEAMLGERKPEPRFDVSDWLVETIDEDLTKSLRGSGGMQIENFTKLLNKLTPGLVPEHFHGLETRGFVEKLEASYRKKIGELVEAGRLKEVPPPFYYVRSEKVVRYDAEMMRVVRQKHKHL